MIELQKGRYEIMIPSQTITDGATVTANIDCRDGDYLSLIMNLGIEETTDATTAVLSILESDDTVVTNFATITEDVNPAAVTAKLQLFHIDLRDRKRFIRVSFTAGTETGGNLPLGVTGVLSRLSTAPATTTDMVKSTNDIALVIPA